MAEVETNRPAGQAGADEGGSSLLPMDAEDRFAAGLEAARAEDVTRARRHLRHVAAARPDWAEAWVWLAALTDNTWEAISCLNRALEATPDDPLAQEALGWVQERLAEGRALEPLKSPFVRELAARAPAGQSPPAGPPEPSEALAAASPQETQPGMPWRAVLRRWFPFLGLVVAATAVLALSLGLSGISFPTMALGQGATPSATPRSTSAPTTDPEAWLEAQWPAVEQAREAGRWAEVIPLLEEMRAADPANALAREALLEAYRQEARKLVSQGLLEEALMYADRAVNLRPDDPRWQGERQAVQAYMEGMKHHRAGEWQAAIQALGRVYEFDPAYEDVGEILYSAYLNLGLAEKAAGRLKEARKAFDGALAIRPDGKEALAKRQEVMDLLYPTPTPTPVTNKRIEVDISEQHFYAYEGDRLVYSFVCSTGGYASPTAPGRYQVLDKIPMAYASTWDLQMPYWLGIYWVGNIENGIHALPILSSGQVLWDGYLGQRVSYGCIILGTEAARIIYHWADIGTPVIIRN